MTSVQFVVVETHGSKLLEDISKQQGVSFEIEVVIISKVVHVKFSPNILGMLVIFIADFFFGQVVVEKFTSWQFKLIESIKGIEVRVWEYSFSRQKWNLVFWKLLPDNLELFRSL